MKERAKADEPPQDKHSYSLFGIFAWFLAALVVYIVSTGPVVWMTQNGYVSTNNRLLERFYGPLDWVYDQKFLHKPFGMYLHLWLPKRFNEKGEIK